MKLTIAQRGWLLPANQAVDTAAPTMDTIMEVAASIDAQAKGIEEAVRYGQQRRAEAVTAIVSAQESMLGSTEHLNTAVDELVAKAQQPLELPAAPALPAAVTAQAPHLLPGPAAP
jgi:hypothetical protein